MQVYKCIFSVYVHVGICTYSNPDSSRKLKVRLGLLDFSFLVGWFWFVFWLVLVFVVVKVDE